MPDIVSTTLEGRLEIHVELATRTKMFSRAPSPAHPDHPEAAQHPHRPHRPRPSRAQRRS